MLENQEHDYRIRPIGASVKIVKLCNSTPLEVTMCIIISHLIYNIICMDTSLMWELARIVCWGTHQSQPNPGEFFHFFRTRQPVGKTYQR
jgi:hypothetical protein